MDTLISILVSVIVLSQLMVITNCKQCVKHSNCICVFDDDSGMIDMSAIGKTDGTPLFLDQVATADQFLYSYNPCGSFSEVDCVNVAACQYSPFMLVSYDVGIPDKVSFNYDGLKLVARYDSQDGTRKSFITLVCDPLATIPKLEVSGETVTTEYYMTMTSAAACAVPSSSLGDESGGLSLGSVLLIICLVLVVVYVVAGVAFNKVKREAQGKELVPNREFWAVLPALIREGCKYSFGLASSLRRRRGGYAPK